MKHMMAYLNRVWAGDRTLDLSPYAFNGLLDDIKRFDRNPLALEMLGQQVVLQVRDDLRAALKADQKTKAATAARRCVPDESPRACSPAAAPQTKRPSSGDSASCRLGKGPSHAQA